MTVLNDLYILNKAAPDQFHVTPPYRVGGGGGVGVGRGDCLYFYYPINTTASYQILFNCVGNALLPASHIACLVYRSGENNFEHFRF